MIEQIFTYYGAWVIFAGMMTLGIVASDGWDHANRFGKVCIVVFVVFPLVPIVTLICLLCGLLDLMFSKRPSFFRDIIRDLKAGKVITKV